MPWRYKQLTGLIGASLIMAGCTSNIPLSIQNSPPENPGVESVRANTTDYVKRPVRWGGSIAKIENKQTETWVEIVEKELRRGGQPLTTDKSQGRFIARIQGFLDPEIYDKGRQLTVSGVLEQAVTRPIGDFTYLYPVVNVETFYLWEKESDAGLYDPAPYWFYRSWYYDPWYSPYPYPYYPHYRRH